jgi:NADPH-dependent 2,4-dienoyl-CoA reductase/sulfur reductase-like enzyme
MISDILIIGAGPSGLAAASAAAESGAQIDIIDDNFMSGGQIWRGGAQSQSDIRAQALWKTLSNCDHVRFHFQSKVVHVTQKDDEYTVVVETQGVSEPQIFSAKKILLCTGARELLLPFPGWTLNGVTGAGGLQALTKAGYPVEGKSVIIAGTGPLMLAVAATLIERGATVTHIIEQATFTKLSRFAFGLLATPSKIKQAFTLGRALKETIYHADSYVLSAHGDTQVQNVRVSVQGEIQEFTCDMLACGYGLIPNIELAAAFGCQLNDDSAYQKVAVNEWQESSQAGVYCAGEGTGIGGVDLALAEGYIAGYAASSNITKAQQYFSERTTWQRFAIRLHTAFRLRSELRQLCNDDTIVCRCEDVSYGQLQQYRDWRDAKLHTRCGMGACQGRICGSANRFLFSWEKDAGRLPISTAKIASILSVQAEKKMNN